MNKKCLSCIHCEVCSFIDSDTAKLEACDFYTEGCKDAISRQAVKELFQEACEMKMYDFLGIEDLPSVTPQPKIGKCKNCRWWKDSDGVYRRGVGADSQCPINRKEVFEGTGYCYMFESQESEGEK